MKIGLINPDKELLEESTILANRLKFGIEREGHQIEETYLYNEKLKDIDLAIIIQSVIEEQPYRRIFKTLPRDIPKIAVILTNDNRKIVNLSEFALYPLPHVFRVRAPWSSNIFPVPYPNIPTDLQENVDLKGDFDKVIGFFTYNYRRKNESIVEIAKKILNELHSDELLYINYLKTSRMDDNAEFLLQKLSETHKNLKLEFSEYYFDNKKDYAQYLGRLRACDILYYRAFPVETENIRIFEDYLVSGKPIYLAKYSDTFRLIQTSYKGVYKALTLRETLDNLDNLENTQPTLEFDEVIRLWLGTIQECTAIGSYY